MIEKGYLTNPNTGNMFYPVTDARCVTGMDYVLKVYDTSEGYDARTKRLRSANLTVGDMLIYDHKECEYLVVDYQYVADFLASYDTTRYETNYDTFIGIVDGVAHFVARGDAYSQTGMYTDYYYMAATPNFYRIEIEVGEAGSITFSATSGNASISSTTLSWTASNTLAEITAMFTALNNTSNYITFEQLADGSGVGLEIGGNGANTFTETATTNCEVIDCSTLAMYASENNVAVGDTYSIQTINYSYISDAHKSWRGSTAYSILGSPLITNSSSCIANTGYNYSYRTGLTFAKFKSWASTNAINSFISDGVNGSTNNSAGNLMRQSIFNSSVVSTATGDALKMYEYYNHLLNDTSGAYYDIREEYQKRYGTMSTLYDAYLMSHMADVSANTGCIALYRNKGKMQTSYKSDVLNVTYNYLFIPAYQQEYNARQYCKTGSGAFYAGMYYHPEPVDLALFMRDDIRVKVDSNITASGGGTTIGNSTYRGSCADYGSNSAWRYSGGRGCVDYGDRYSSSFLSRPVLAYVLTI